MNEFSRWNFSFVTKLSLLTQILSTLTQAADHACLSALRASHCSILNQSAHDFGWNVIAFKLNIQAWIFLYKAKLSQFLGSFVEFSKTFNVFWFSWKEIVLGTDGTRLKLFLRVLKAAIQVNELKKEILISHLPHSKRFCDLRVNVHDVPNDSLTTKSQSSTYQSVYAYGLLWISSHTCTTS